MANNNKDNDDGGFEKVLVTSVKWTCRHVGQRVATNKARTVMYMDHALA